MSEFKLTVASVWGGGGGFQSFSVLVKKDSLPEKFRVAREDFIVLLSRFYRKGLGDILSSGFLMIQGLHL